LKNITDRPLVHITEESGPPLFGHTAFGIRTYGTNLIEVRPLTGCQLRCPHCYVAEGLRSETRTTDYIIDDLKYLQKTVDSVAEHLGRKRLEVHLSAQGELLLHPQFVEIIMSLSEIQGIETISMQTNGANLSEQLLVDMEYAGLDRINLSLNSLNPERAILLAGTRNYDLEHILHMIQCIADSSIDLLLAPVLVPGINDDDIPQIIHYARTIPNERHFPRLGIQKYLTYRLGRRFRDIKPWPWEKFYRHISSLERKTGYKPLLITPQSFGIHPRRQMPIPFRVREKITVQITHPGRVNGEYIASSRNRAIQVINAKVQIGTNIRVQIIRTRGNTIIAKPI